MVEKNGRQMGRLMRPSNKITVAFVSLRVERDRSRFIFRTNLRRGLRLIGTRRLIRVQLKGELKGEFFSEICQTNGKIAERFTRAGSISPDFLSIRRTFLSRIINPQTIIVCISFVP